MACTSVFDAQADLTPDALVEWRLDHALDQWDLGGRLGVNHATVWRWENSVSALPPFLWLALNELERRLEGSQWGRQP